MRRLPVAVWRLILLAGLLALWQVLALLLGKLLLPLPLSVFEAAGTLLGSGLLLTATAQSVVVFGVGYLLAVVVAIPLGVLMGGYRRFGETLEIYVNAMNSTPRVAFVPLVIVWFGLDFTAKIVMVFIFAVFPMIINTYAGVLHTSPELIEAARSFGARPRQVFRYVMLPSAIPYIIAGLRIGASLAIIGTVVAELYTALSGLGYLLAQFGNTFQTAKYFVPVLVLIGIGVLVSEGLKFLERRVAGWRPAAVEL